MPGKMNDGREEAHGRGQPHLLAASDEEPMFRCITASDNSLCRQVSARLCIQRARLADATDIRFDGAGVVDRRHANITLDCRD